MGILEMTIMKVLKRPFHLGAGLTFLLLSACSPLPGIPLAPGIGYEQKIETGAVPERVHIVYIDLQQPGMRFAVTSGDNTRGMEHVARLTSAYLAESGARLAFNASYFLPFKGGSKGGEDYYPHIGDPVNVSGAAMAQGVTVSPVETDLDDRVDSMLCFKQALVVIVDGQQCPAHYTDGVAAGPRLLRAGQAVASTLPYATERHPRTAFGISKDGRRAWVIIVDGRQPDSAGMPLADLTALFVTLGASDAINLDGGGSSTLVTADGHGGAMLLNRPIHTGIVGRERPVANHILLFVPGKPGPLPALNVPATP